MKVVCGAECLTDHRLFKLKLCILLMIRPQGQETAKRLNVSKLKCSRVAEDFSNVLENKVKDTVQDYGASIEDQRSAFRDVVYSTAYEHLEPATRRNQD